MEQISYGKKYIDDVLLLKKEQKNVQPSKTKTTIQEYFYSCMVVYFRLSV